MKRNPALYLALILAALFMAMCPAGGVALAQTPEPESTPDTAGEEGAAEPEPTGLLDEVVGATRTPAPTATPGPIDERVEQLAYAVGLSRTEFLGLSAADWINLGISILLVLFGYLLGTWLIRRVLPRVVRRSATEFDDRALKDIGPSLRWLVVILVLHFSTIRLSFVSPEAKKTLGDFYFVVGLAIGLRIVWNLIDLADAWYRERVAAAERADQLDPLITLLVRVGRVVLMVVGITILLSHFGVNVTAFAAALGLGGLAFSLAARDTIADAIAGFIILVDQPFRIGDRIEIQGIGTWGDVVDIGLRTTRIRTRDNRLVIVPNSVIGANQVINYTYPDPQYRIQTHVGIAYGTDIERARQIIVGTVRHVEGVLKDKPVDALYIEMGESSMIFRVRWWIESYEDTRRMFDRVHTVLQNALDAEGIESPFPTQNLNLRLDGEASGQLSGNLPLPGQAGREA
ncbi:MAG: mechanosensitive ion channel family protein [Anaerolineae bacterium]|jgi:small-conductance mechanosensitive channel